MKYYNFFISTLIRLTSILKFDIPRRLGRLEYFLNTLQIVFAMLLLVAFAIIPTIMFNNQVVHVVRIMLLGLIISWVFFVSIRCQISRLHDLNISGWWILAIILIQVIFNFIWRLPYVNYVFAALFFLLPGTKGPNKFGDLSAYLKKKNDIINLKI